MLCYAEAKEMSNRVIRTSHIPPSNPSIKYPRRLQQYREVEISHQLTECVHSGVSKWVDAGIVILPI
jgi:hypothetical protein